MQSVFHELQTTFKYNFDYFKKYIFCDAFPVHESIKTDHLILPNIRINNPRHDRNMNSKTNQLSRISYQWSDYDLHWCRFELFQDFHHFDKLKVGQILADPRMTFQPFWNVNTTRTLEPYWNILPYKLLAALKKFQQPISITENKTSRTLFVLYYLPS